MSCDLFERDGLLQLARGIQLDAHFDTCPDCREARRVYAQLHQLVAELDSAVEPSPAWKARVRQQIEHRRSPSSPWAASESVAHVLLGGPARSGGEMTRSGRIAHRIHWPPDRARIRWVWWIAPVGAIAAISILLVWPRHEGTVITDPAVVSLTAEIYRDQKSIRRGEDAHPGDMLHVTGAAAGYEQAELRVYFNDKELAAQCSSENPCTRVGNTISITALMRSIGTYRPVFVLSNRPIPAAVAELDRDAAAALKAGAVVKAGDPIQVR